MASLSRRGALAGAAGLLLAGCGETEPVTASRTPPLDTEQLRRAFRELQARARPAVLGLGVTNLESGQIWALRGGRPFPMQSVFKVVLAAYALGEVEAGRLALDERIVLEDHDLSPYSAIGDAFPVRRDYTVRELLLAAVTRSDNTAADVLMKRVQGPGALTAWLDAKGVQGVRVDRYEREIQTEMFGMASYRAAWKGDAAFRAARDAVPPATRMAAVQAFMKDPRDSATPYGMMDFLGKLDSGALISPSAAAWLLKQMVGTPTATRLTAGAPKGAQVAHKSGTAATDQDLCAAVNDVGLMTLADGRTYAVVAFMRGSTASSEARDALIAEVTRIVARAIG